MVDDALIRLANLKALRLAPKVLSAKIGGRESYWSDLLRGKKSFGEKIARKIEEALELPRGALDAADRDLSAEARAIAAAYQKMSTPERKRFNLLMRAAMTMLGNRIVGK